MGLPVFVPEMILLGVIDHAEIVVAACFVEDFPVQGAHLEVSPESGSGSTTCVFGVGECGADRGPPSARALRFLGYVRKWQIMDA